MENKELNLNEMEEVSGGKGGSKTPLPEQPGFDVYKIVHGDTLSGIAGKYKTTVKYLMSINPTITDPDDITSGRYIYVPKRLR